MTNAVRDTMRDKRSRLSCQSHVTSRYFNKRQIGGEPLDVWPFACLKRALRGKAIASQRGLKFFCSEFKGRLLTNDSSAF